MASNFIQTGALVGGKFRIDRVLGQGGNGLVVAATQMKLGRTVALKFLLPHAHLNRDAVARFLREARIAVSIRSQHVVEVLDVGELESGEPYLAMEFLHGSNLARLISGRKGVGLPVQEAVEYALQACEGLAEAHARGIVHRDVKPTNLFLVKGSDGDPVLKVLDFGICKSEMDGSEPITLSAVALGSPPYMSPEQIRSARRVDERTDIWSLGVVLYEMLEGVTPFRASAIPDLFIRIVSEPMEPMVRMDVPEGLVAVIGHCLVRERGDRFSTVGELAHALTPFGPGGAAVRAERIARILNCACYQNESIPSVADENIPAVSPQLVCLPDSATPEPLVPAEIARVDASTNPSPLLERPHTLNPSTLTSSPSRLSRIAWPKPRHIYWALGMTLIGGGVSLTVYYTGKAALRPYDSSSREVAQDAGAPGQETLSSGSASEPAQTAALGEPPFASAVARNTVPSAVSAKPTESPMPPSSSHHAALPPTAAVSSNTVIGTTPVIPLRKTPVPQRGGYAPTHALPHPTSSVPPEPSTPKNENPLGNVRWREL